MADLQHKIDELAIAALERSGGVVAPLVSWVQGVLDSITDLAAFPAALAAAIPAMPDATAEAWRGLLERLLIAAMLTGRMGVARQPAAGGERAPIVLADQDPGAVGFDPIPFDQAIDAARERIDLPRSIFDQLSREVKSRVFTVAWQNSAKVLADIHDAFNRTLQSGGGVRDFRQQLPQMVDEAGWGGDRPWHADLVFRQQSQMAYTAGRFEQMSDAGIERWQYSSLHDGRTRPTHLALDGKIFDMADRRYYPPWEFNCRCVAEPVFDTESNDVRTTESDSLVGKHFGNDPVTGEALRFPAGASATAEGNRFEWNPAKFSQVEPLKVSEIPDALRDAIQQLFRAKGIELAMDTTQDDESDPEALSDRLRKSEGEKVKTRQLELLFDSGLASAPKRFLLLPWGTVETRKGNYVLDELAARDVIAEFRRGGVDVVIDRDHQSLGGKYSAPDGSAPAMGWIKDLETVKGEGVYALVDWTPKGREALSNREYRYHSPVIDVNDQDLRAVRLRCASLTNLPATLNAVPLVNKDDVSGDDGRSVEPGASKEQKIMKNVAVLLALKEDASEVDVVGAVKALGDKAGKGEKAARTLKLVCSELGVGEDQPDEKITGAIQALKGTEQTVKVLSEEVKALRNTVAGGEADKLISAARDAGKLTVAMESWARKYILNDRDGFIEWEKTAPIVREPGRTTPPPSEGGTGGSDRRSLILSARDEFRKDEGKPRLVTSERVYVNGSILARGQRMLTDEEAKEHQILS